MRQYEAPQLQWLVSKCHFCTCNSLPTALQTMHTTTPSQSAPCRPMCTWQVQYALKTCVHTAAAKLVFLKLMYTQSAQTTALPASQHTITIKAAQHSTAQSTPTAACRPYSCQLPMCLVSSCEITPSLSKCQHCCYQHKMRTQLQLPAVRACISAQHGTPAIHTMVRSLVATCGWCVAACPASPITA